MGETGRISIVDVVDADRFALIPPCADPGFDHRSCDYWEDAERGSKAARLAWLAPAPRERATPPTTASSATNPFLADLEERVANPFATPGGGGPSANPFLIDDDPLADNPFAPRPVRRATVDDDAPRKLRLLARGLGVAGSYAKVLLVDDDSAAYCQFGPLTAYPRAQRTRDLYPALPEAPLPAVITCIATTPESRHQGHAKELVDDVCVELGRRGFSAVEVYPDLTQSADATSAATPDFWQGCGFALAVNDERFPVLRRELG